MEVFKYKTENERKELIDRFPDKKLIEDRILLDGTKELIFSDEPDLREEVRKLRIDVDQLKSKLLIK